MKKIHALVMSLIMLFIGAGTSTECGSSRQKPESF